MVVLFQQYVENRDFFSNFSINGLHSQDILLIIPLELQRKSRCGTPSHTCGESYGTQRGGSRGQFLPAHARGILRAPTAVRKEALTPAGSLDIRRP